MTRRSTAHPAPAFAAGNPFAHLVAQLTPRARPARTCVDLVDKPQTKTGVMREYLRHRGRAERITVSLECLENLLTCANELLQARRETTSGARSNTPNVANKLPP